LGDDPIARQQNYRALFEQALDVGLIDNIRKTTNKGMAIGNVDFIKEIEALTGYDMTCKDRGRPRRTVNSEQLTIKSKEQQPRLASLS
jgi:putative transposase